jgi:hypothetical protein
MTEARRIEKAAFTRSHVQLCSWCMAIRLERRLASTWPFPLPASVSWCRFRWADFDKNSYLHSVPKCRASVLFDRIGHDQLRLPWRLKRICRGYCVSACSGYIWGSDSFWVIHFSEILVPPSRLHGATTQKTTFGINFVKQKSSFNELKILRCAHFLQMTECFRDNEHQIFDFMTCSRNRQI